MDASIFIVLLLAQLVLLSAMWKLSTLGATTVLATYFNPIAFVALFYFLSFGLPQLYFLLPGSFLIGFDELSSFERLQISTATQITLVVFLLCLIIGIVLASRSHTSARLTETQKNLMPSPSAFEMLYFLGLFLLGLASTIYLGVQLTTLGGFRSELVQSTTGQIITAFALMGNFSFSILLFFLVGNKKYFLAFALLSVFAIAVVFTGARGRLLWPLVIAGALYFSHRNVFPKFRVLLIAALIALVLVLLDPIRLSLIDPTSGFSLSEVHVLEEFFQRRNFDGFANLALIVEDTSIEPSLSYLVTGVREAFMLRFFPIVYQNGIGFGATLPGYFLFSGGFVGLIGLSIIFGLVLALVNSGLRTTRNRWLVYSYFFGIIWFAAVGGNLVASLPKMMISMMPGLFYFMFLQLMKR